LGSHHVLFYESQINWGLHNLGFSITIAKQSQKERVDMSIEVIGREAELEVLEEIYQSDRSEFVAMYGRRRVGKTFLIRQFFSQKTECWFFQVSGIQNATAKEQFEEFRKEIVRVFYSSLKSTQLAAPKSWLDAFEMLQEAITLFGGNKQIVLFFDEFPWMAQRKRKLLQALDYYWNRYWSSMRNIKLVICGSVASWIIKNILNNKGGLHNRVTRRMPMAPFTLQETKDYLKKRGILYDHYQILQLYMCIGGIPYYLDMLKKGFSASQNINQLCFQRQGSLFDEFHNLFTALFDKGSAHETIIQLIAAKREGVSRDEIATKLAVKGGTLTLWLKELAQAGFIESFMPLGRKYGTYYKVIDEYTLFYLNWIAPLAKAGFQAENTTPHWEEMSQTPGWNAWAGLAFEAVCYKHIGRIRKALHIPGGATAGTWR
jgi:AAA+ ATPase superfamily predicted ATPase